MISNGIWGFDGDYALNSIWQLLVKYMNLSHICNFLSHDYPRCNFWEQNQGSRLDPLSEHGMDHMHRAEYEQA